jgi:hypothetical protein
MRTRPLFGLTILAIATGCSQSQPTAVTSETSRTVTVSADNPIILDGDSRIGVDGIPDGETTQLRITETKNDDGLFVVVIDSPANAE